MDSDREVLCGILNAIRPLSKCNISCGKRRIRCDRQGRVTNLEPALYFGYQQPALISVKSSFELEPGWRVDPHRHVTLPREVGKLEALKTIDLSCGIQGTVPTEVGNFHALENFSLVYNSFEGTIPTQVGRLQKLRNLFLAFNCLTGAVPSELGSLRSLWNLELSDNFFVASIPCEMGNLVSLSGWNAWSAGLAGSIPAQLGRLQQLNYLQLPKNSLEGSLPCQLANIKKIKWLFLFKSSLLGTMPSELGNLQKLKYLLLGSNSLEGAIPSELGKLQIVVGLHLSSNSLEGTIPSRLTILGYASFHENRLSGKLHYWRAASHHAFTVLTLHRNNFGGRAPALKFSLQHSSASLSMTDVAEPDSGWENLPLLTLFGNALSCRLPDYPIEQRTSHVFASGQQLNSSVSLIGNGIHGPLPSWVPDFERDAFMYFSRSYVRTCLLEVLVWLVALGTTIRCILGTDTAPYLRCIFSAEGRFPRPCECYNVVVCGMAKIVAISLFALSPLYHWGAYFWQCNIGAPCISILGNAFAAEWAVGACFVAHYVVVLLCLEHTMIPEQTNRNWFIPRSLHLFMNGYSAAGFCVMRTTLTHIAHSMSSIRQSIFGWVVWTGCLCCLSTPFVFYILGDVLPKENILVQWMGPKLFVFLRLPSVWFGVMLIEYVLRPVASYCAQCTGVHCARLMLGGRIFVMWGLPTLMLFLMLESCLGGWLRFWCICDKNNPNHDRFDVTLFSSSKWSVSLVSTAQMCRMQSVWEALDNTRCGRDVVFHMGRMLLFKFMFRTTCWPCVVLWSWYVSANMFGGKVMLLRGPVQRSHLTLQLFITLQLAITWCPLFCLLAPLLMLSLAVDLTLFQIGSQRFQIVEPDNELDWTEQCQQDMKLMAWTGFLFTLCITLQSKIWSSVLTACVPGVWLVMSLLFDKQRAMAEPAPRSSLTIDPRNMMIECTPAVAHSEIELPLFHPRIEPQAGIVDCQNPI